MGEVFCCQRPLEKPNIHHLPAHTFALGKMLILFRLIHCFLFCIHREAFQLSFFISMTFTVTSEQDFIYWFQSCFFLPLFLRKACDYATVSWICIVTLPWFFQNYIFSNSAGTKTGQLLPVTLRRLAVKFILKVTCK